MQLMDHPAIILFLHIPKAGGTTLHSIINRQYATQEIHTFTSTNLHGEIENFINFPSESKRKLRMIKGHFYYGLHHYLPKPCNYITMLREPVSRIVSYYNYLKYDIDPNLPISKKVQSMSLEEYSACSIHEQYHVQNEQTMVLSGIMSRNKFWENPELALQKAKENLKNEFLFVGLSERFNESLLILKELLGWKQRLYYQSMNKGSKKPYQEQVSTETRKIIKENNYYDTALYAHAEKIFDEYLNKYPFLSLKSFERKNAIYQRLAPLYNKYLKINDF